MLYRSRRFHRRQLQPLRSLNAMAQSRASTTRRWFASSCSGETMATTGDPDRRDRSTRLIKTESGRHSPFRRIVCCQLRRPALGAPFGLIPEWSNFNAFQQPACGDPGQCRDFDRATPVRNSDRGASLPHNLFSHEDQQGQMQTATSTPSAQTGWAGRTADKIQQSLQAATSR